MCGMCDNQCSTIVCNVCVWCDRQAYIVVMKTVKLLLTAVAFANVQVVVDLCNARTPQVMVGTPEHTRAVLLQQAIACMPSPQSEHMMRNVASKIGQTLKAKVSFILACVPLNLLV